MKSKKRLFTIFFFILFLCLCMTACQKKNSQSMEDQEARLFTYKLPVTKITQNLRDIEFVPEGLIGVPKENNSPVVFLFHGSHEQGEGISTPYYEGFSYLVKALAEQGYFAVSLNVNQAYVSEDMSPNALDTTKQIFRKNYEALVQATEGKKIFDVSLKDKADWSRVNMIGHSRGGESITGIIQDRQFHDVSFVSALKIAAAVNIDHKFTYADIPTASVLSQYDEDVAGLESIWDYYYAYLGDEVRKEPITTAYLYGGNHAAFNTEVNQKGMYDHGDVTYLDPDMQRDFLIKYTNDFLSIYNGGSSKLTDVFNDDTPKRYGIDFMPSVFIPDGIRLLKPDRFQSELTVNGMQMDYVEYSSRPKYNQAGPLYLPGDYDRIPLYRIEWDKAGGSITMPIDYIMYKIQKNTQLSFSMILNSPSEKNSADKPMEFDVMLTDANGRKETFRFSSEISPALRYQAGKMVDQGDYMKWSDFSPIGTGIIDLRRCRTIQPEDGIMEITITPVSRTGSLFLAGIDTYELIKDTQ